MALDSDDIKKLDEHIVEPLLQAVEALGDRIDGLGDRIDGLGDRIDGLGNRIDGLGNRIDGLGSRIEVFGERIERSNASLVAEIVKSNEDLRDRTAREVERVVVINEQLLELLRQAEIEKHKKN